MADDHKPHMPMPGVTAHLTVSDGAAAIDFYRAAFGAEEHDRAIADDGRRIMNAQLRINGGAVMLHDDFPEYRGGAALSDPTGVALHLQVDDADRWFARAVAAGGVVTMPLADMFWGDRYGEIRDPFGHHWGIGATISQGAGA